MTTIITRTFAAHAQAQAAVDKLQQHGLRAGEIQLISAGEGAHNALVAAGVHQPDLAHYAKQIEDGATVLIARARFGLANGAIQIVDACGPMVSHAVHAERYDRMPMDPTPFSSFMNWPTLSRSKTPFASFFNVPTLSRSRTPLSNLLSLPLLTESRTMFPAANLTSKNRTPLSSALGWSTLSHSPTPLSSALGLPVLSDRGQQRR